MQHQVFVRTLEGHTLCVDVSPSDSLLHLCSKLDDVKQREYGHSFEGEASRPRRISGRRLIVKGTHLRQADGCLDDLGITKECTIFEVGSLFGGGCDGGTTALQRKFMSQASTKKKDEVRDQTEESRAKWTMCAASGEPLKDDLLACDLGYLFNKETILKKLALRKQVPMHENFKHIQKRSHLFELKLEVNPDYDPLSGAATRVHTNPDVKYICPITKRPANGKSPFVAFKPCGHVVSEQCVKEIKIDGCACVVCGMAYDKTGDLVFLNLVGDRLTERRKVILEARAAEKASAKANKAEGDSKRTPEDCEAKAAKRAKLGELVGAGASVGDISSSLTNMVGKSATLGTAAHANRAKADANYASMFQKKKKGQSDYDAAWGQGAMAGVLGSR